MATSRKTIKNIGLVISSLAFTILLVVVAEVIIRNTTNLTFHGASAHLFTPNVFRDSYGYTKNTEATAHGVKVFTDAHGFRVDRNDFRRVQAQYDSTILVLGDSVGFGLGVEFPDTFIGRLTVEDPQLRFYNTSVMGYAVDDYKNVTDLFVPAHINEINAAFLIYCLNDIDRGSAKNIDMALVRGNANVIEAEQSAAKHRTVTDLYSIINDLKRWRAAARVNEYLRARSKLYLLIKGVFTDPRTRWWEGDLQHYKQLKAEGLASVLDPLRYIAEFFGRHNITFTVIILPYEYQVRVDDENTRLPQQMLADFFEANQIRYVDALPLFRKRLTDSPDAFLPYDPMHLSPQGHEILYQIVSEAFTHGEVSADNS